MRRPTVRPRLATRVTPSAGVWVCAVVAFVVRVVYVVATPGYRPVHDAADYQRLSALIAGGHGFGQSAIVGHGPTAFRAPGYPVFLAAVRLVDHSVTAARLGQAVLGALTVALVGLLARECLGDRAGVASAALCAAYPPLVAGGGSLVAEVVFTPLMLLMLLVVVRLRGRSETAVVPMALAGAAGGLAVLTRPNGYVVIAVAVVVVMVAATASVRTRVVRAGVLVGVAAVVVTPWLVRTAVEFHRFVPVTDQSGYVLAGTYNEQARTDPRWPGAWRPENYVPAFQPILTDSRLNELELSQALSHAAVTYARAHPAYVAEAVARNTARFVEFGEAAYSRQSSAAYGVGERTAVVNRWSFRVMFVLSLLGFAATRRRRDTLALWLTPLLITASTVVASGDVRHRMPVEPFVVVFATPAMLWAVRRIARVPVRTRTARQLGTAG